MDRIKDFLHNFSDIFFAIVVAGVMVVALSMNLGSLFNNTSNTVSANETVHIVENKDTSSILEDDNKQVDLEDTEETTANDNNSEDDSVEKIEDVHTDSNVDLNENETPPETTVTTPEVKTIVIPNGTPGSGVATILKQNGLIEDTATFIKTAENLNLAIRLKSGTFEISTNATIEDMVRIIAGQKR